MEKHVRNALARWQEKFHLTDYSIDTQRISLFQVSSIDDHCCESVGCSLVGIEIDRSEKQACIYHTRRLTEEDIVHELLHILNQEWTEEQVNAATALLLKKKVVGMTTNRCSSNSKIR